MKIILKTDKDLQLDAAYEVLAKLTDQKNQAYAERNKVVAALANILYGFECMGMLVTSKIGIAQHPADDEQWEEDWRTILVIESTLYGQMTWHFHDSEKYLLEGLPEFENYKWDGHTTEEKYKRLRIFSQ